MSPEFISWSRFLSTDKLEFEVKQQVKEAVYIDRKELNQRVHRGFFVLVTEGNVRRIIDPDEATPGIKKNASQIRGDWIYIHGLNNRQRARNTLKTLIRQREITLDNPPPRDRDLRHRKRYRGKHRSHNKNSGLFAFFRKPENARK